MRLQPKHMMGILLFFVSAFLILGLFAIEDVKAMVPVSEKQAPVVSNTNISSEPAIYEYHAPTMEEQVTVDLMCIGLMLFLLGFVYIGGIVYDEYSHIQDDE